MEPAICRSAASTRLPLSCLPHSQRSTADADSAPSQTYSTGLAISRCARPNTKFISRLFRDQKNWDGQRRQGNQLIPDS